MLWFILGCTTLPSLILVDSSVSLLPKSSKQEVAPIGQWEFIGNSCSFRHSQNFSTGTNDHGEKTNIYMDICHLFIYISFIHGPSKQWGKRSSALFRAQPRSSVCSDWASPSSVSFGAFGVWDPLGMSIRGMTFHEKSPHSIFVDSTNREEIKYEQKE